MLNYWSGLRLTNPANFTYICYMLIFVYSFICVIYVLCLYAVGLVLLNICDVYYRKWQLRCVIFVLPIKAMVKNFQ